jgi:hypothetical protein
MKKYIAYNISYDTDGENIELPKSMVITAENLEEAEMIGADQISDNTGWCVNSFLIKEI